ncbi:hypothetical protein AB4254_12175 [Vibrio breoganii]
MNYEVLKKDILEAQVVISNKLGSDNIENVKIKESVMRFMLFIQEAEDTHKHSDVVVAKCSETLIHIRAYLDELKAQGFV